ncbi:MAG: hypothetical protein KatS3mg001_435 [Candidatus Pacearchaeota archaeon]|nr:MAG: hypothetical protein KatS3mg001_435 [Candidatus Pacearchaeota archaeon]
MKFQKIDKKQKFNKKIKKNFVVFLEIILMTLSIFAFSYLISRDNLVSAQQTQTSQCVQIGSGAYWRIDGNNVVCYSNCVEPSGDYTGKVYTINYFCRNWLGEGFRKQLCNDPAEASGGSGQYTLKSSVIKSCPSLTKSSGNKQRDSVIKGIVPTVADIPVKAAERKISDIGQRELDRILNKSKKGDTQQGGEAGKQTGGGFLGGILSTKVGKTTLGGLIENAGVAVAIYFGTKFVLNFLKIGSPEFREAFSRGLAGGYFFGKGVLAGVFGASTVVALIGGAVVGALIFALSFKKTRYDAVEFSCLPWDAVTGGQNCEECNKGDIPCTEYRCKSLGQACEIINKGTPEEKCAWLRKDDTTPPVITPWNDVLPLGYKYIPDDKTSPPDRGYRIVPENNVNGCVQPYTPLRFGVTLNEPGKCKLDVVNKRDFESMSRYFGGSSLNRYNHSETIQIPSTEALQSEDITLKSNGEFTIYTRCQDVNGNFNLNNIVFRFCVDQGPDTSPPLILDFSLPNGKPISSNTTEINISAYLNEPSECKWSTLDQSYENMENNMECEQNLFNFNNRQAYQCKTTLTGLKDRQDNVFYFRCLDQPHLKGTENESRRNVNKQSYKYTLIGTRPLIISSLAPNSTTIKDSTRVVKVTLEAETFAGYKNGEAICSYSDTGEEGTYIQFLTTGTNKHQQELNLVQGDHTFYVSCIDLGGNIDTKQINFRVEVDKEPPVIVRVFSDQNNLKVITDEESSCVYSTSDKIACTYNMEDGSNMTTRNNIEHTVSWDPNKNFYIKCQDKFGNQPPVNGCTLIAKAFQV